MRISVIVPTYNEGKLVGKCLEALRRQTFRDYEIVVIDGHSTDDTVEIAKKYADRVLFDEGRGAAAARNLAVRQVDSEIVAFVDADTRVYENWLELINKNFERGVIGVGGPLLPELGCNFVDRLLFVVCADMLRRFSSMLGVHQFSGANCAYLRKTHLKAGGFREDLDMLDDVEFSARVGRYGRGRFDPELRAMTSLRRTRRKGHACTIFGYLKGYLQLIATGKVEKRRYLREIERE